MLRVSATFHYTCPRMERSLAGLTGGPANIAQVSPRPQVWAPWCVYVLHTRELCPGLVSTHPALVSEEPPPSALPSQKRQGRGSSLLPAEERGEGSGLVWGSTQGLRLLGEGAQDLQAAQPALQRCWAGRASGRRGQPHPLKALHPRPLGGHLQGRGQPPGARLPG